jgi:sporulation protein YlmC with PRC-barrel domain
VAIGGFELVGKDVITSDGRNVGTVTDLAIDAAAWTVRDLRVAIDKRIAEELGLQTRRGGMFLIKTASVKSVGDLIMLNQTMKMLAEAAGSAGKTGDAEPFD